MISGLFENATYKLFVFKSYIYISMYKQDLALNNLGWYAMEHNQPELS